MPDDCDFRYPVRPRYYEIDQQGVLFNAWYLAYFDEAMAACLEHRGLPLPELNRRGNDTHLVHIELDWLLPVRHGDQAEVVVTTEAIGRTSFTLGFEVWRAGECTCRARTVYVVVETGTWTKAEVPDFLRAPWSAEDWSAEDWSAQPSRTCSRDRPRASDSSSRTRCTSRCNAMPPCRSRSSRARTAATMNVSSTGPCAARAPSRSSAVHRSSRTSGRTAMIDSISC
jgi:acyl-CoA thioester hydrolase